ncbi:MAG: DUF1963 domain-containing protein [Saprospiraceae bacterium]|nr:DUF1963 domain-containing protein [Saprospiraceae bacterium]
MELPLNLPEALLPFQDQLAATRKDFVKIVLSQAPLAHPWSGKLGGNPWWPQHESWPVSPDGIQLLFLAQINFEEIPHIADFPRQGLLQFFIFDDFLYGQNPDQASQQSTFRVIYRPEIHHNTEGLVTDFSFLRSYRYDDLPIEPGAGLAFEYALQSGYLPPDDGGFEATLGKDFFAQFGAAEWVLQDAWRRLAASRGHKIGGYPHFTQYDPRPAGSNLTLLFQLDSDPGKGILWGDMGTAQFFIHPEKLRHLDFSEVSYYWDCY